MKVRVTRSTLEIVLLWVFVNSFGLALGVPEYYATVGRTIDADHPSGLVYRDDGFWALTWSYEDGTRLSHFSAATDTWGVLLGDYDVPEAYLVQGLAWDGAHWWIADNIHPSGDNISKCNLTDSGLSVLQSYNWPHSAPVSLEWAGGYLWVADNSTDTIYRVTVGETALESIESWCTTNPEPYGLAWDQANIWSLTGPSGGFDPVHGEREIYKHDAGGNVIEIWHYPAVEPIPPEPYGSAGQGLTFAQNRLFYSDTSQQKIIELIPEPSTLLLLGLGGVALVRKRRA